MLPLALIAASLAFIAVLIWRAPMGWESEEHGFQLGPEPDPIPPAASTPAGRAPGVAYLSALGAHSVSAPFHSTGVTDA